MHKKAYIFIGQSGAGKGTQIALLEKKLLTVNSLATFLSIETGVHFRELMDETTVTGARTRALMEQGKLPPAFLGIHMWSTELVEHYNGEDAVIFDGTPRMVDEVPLLIGACQFYDLQVSVINIQVGDDWAYEKSKVRARSDDTSEAELHGKISWFHSHVSPVIDMLSNNTFVTMHTINGEQTVEAVHEEICKSLQII